MAEGIPRNFQGDLIVTPASFGFALSVFNKNFGDSALNDHLVQMI